MARRLKRLAGFGCLLAVLVVAIGGCAGMTQSPAQLAHNRKVSLDYDARQLVDDIDMFLLLERDSRLTRWHVR